MKIMTRNFKLKGLGIPDSPIQPLIDNKIIYNFKYIENGYNDYIIYDNEYLSGHRHVMTLSDVNIACLPKSLEGIKFFRAINPFDKNEFDCTGGRLGFDLITLLFKLGYCDGMITIYKYPTFKPFHMILPIIVVNPEERNFVRKYFEDLYKEYLDELKIEDFGWGIKYDVIPFCYGGFGKEEIKFSEYWDKAEKFVTEKEKRNIEYEPIWKLLDHEQRVEVTSINEYFVRPEYKDYFNKELTIRELVFKNKENAKKIYKIFMRTCNRFETGSIYIQPTNTKYIKSIIQKTFNG